MATKTTGKIEETVVQSKDKAFQKYLDSNKISGFGKQYAGEKGEVVLYRSNLQIQGKPIPFMIVLDNSVYAVIQFQVADGIVAKEKKDRISSYFNDLNNRYRMLKFTCDEAGNVLLTVSIPAGAQYFDPTLVIALLDEVEKLLSAEYEDLMSELK